MWLDRPERMGITAPGTATPNEPGSDGDATQAFLNQPGFVRLDGQANMYIASAFGGVRKIDVTQSVLNFTGSASTNNAFSQQAVNTASAAQTATVLERGQLRSPGLYNTLPGGSGVGHLHLELSA